MKKYLVLVLLGSVWGCAFGQNRFWVAGSASNWNNTANWSVSSGGPTGASVPTTGNAVFFDANGAGNCLLDIAPTVAGLTVNGYAGTINLSGFTLTTSGTVLLTAGTITNSGAAATLTLNTTATTTFNGTLVNVDVTGTSGRVFFNGSTFGRTVNIIKTAANTDAGTGNNTFNGALTLTNASANQWQLGTTNRDIFNSTVTVNSNGTGNTSLAHGSAVASQFNGNVSINYNTTASVLFGSANGLSTLATGATLTVASFGASGCGNLALNHFTSGTNAQTITLAGNGVAVLTIGPLSTFNGNLTATAPSIVLNSSTFVGTTSLTKTGTNDDNLHGGNLFTGPLTVTNTSDNDIYFGHYAAEAGDTFNGISTWNDLGGGRIRIPETSAGTIFNGAATFNSSGANDIGNRIQICRLTGASATFNGAVVINNNGNASDVHVSYDPGTSTTFNGPVTLNATTSNGAAVEFWMGQEGDVTFNNTVTVNNSGTDEVVFGNGAGFATLGIGATITAGSFTGGQLSLENFTQMGTTAQALTLTGTSILRLGSVATFGGNVNFVSNHILLAGTTFNGTAYLEKTGPNTATSSGGNIFNGTTTLVNSGSGQFLLANTNPDKFNADLTVISSGSSTIRLADNSAGNEFNGNVIVNSTATSGGVYFSNSGAGNAIMAATKSISIGGMGFSSGELRIRKFTQNGTAPVTLALTGTCILRSGPSVTFGGNANFVAPQVYLDGTTFGGTAYVEKNGATQNNSIGGNTFSGAATLVCSGSGFFYMSITNPDTFNDNLTLFNLGSASIHMSENGIGNLFNGNIVLNSTSGTGLHFGLGTGTSTLASGKTITIGGSGFTSGSLNLARFTQLGATPINLTLGASATLLRSGPGSSWGGNISFIAPQIYLDGATYAGTLYAEKTGSTDNLSAGGNTFGGASSIVASGSGQLLMADTNPDIFNADVTITNNGSNSIRMADDVAGNQFNGNIFVNSSSGAGIFFSNSATGSSTLAAGKTIAVGLSGFAVGELRIRRFTQLGTAPVNLVLTGVGILRPGFTSSFGGDVNFVAPQVYLEGAAYNGAASIEKNGPTDNTSAGGNTFFGATTLLATGSGAFTMAGTTADIFNADLTVTNSGSNAINLAQNSPGTQFNGNITLNATSGSGIFFSPNAPGNSTLAVSKSVAIGGLGFVSGELNFARFTQLGATPATPLQTLVLGGTATLRVNTGTTFNADVSFKAPQLYLAGATYNGTTYLEKTGATSNTGNGGNNFNATTTIVNSGSANLRTNGSNQFNAVSGTTTLINSGSGDLLLELLTGSTYNGDVFLSNTGTSTVRTGYIGNNFYNGNISVSSTSGGGILFSENAAGTSTLANGKAIATGGGGFSAGTLQLTHFTQLGPTAQTLTLTSNSILQIGSASTFNGSVDFKAPQLLLQGCTYNGVTSLEKTGATNNDSNGNNIFNGVTALTNSGSGWLRLARTTLDQFNNDLTVTNTGTSGIYLSDQVAGSTYGGNIVLNSTLGVGIFFGNNAGTSTLTAGNTISIGGLGFTIGELRLSRFTQVGATNQTIALTGNADIRLGAASTFGGNVDFRAPQVYLDGTTFNGTAYIEKNGAGNNTGTGNNVFASTTTITNTNSGQFRTNGNNTFNGTTLLLNSGSNDLLLELLSGSNYNGDVTMTNTGSSYVRAAYIGTTQFNGNIIVNSINATGVYIGENVASTSVLAANKTISVGATGFSAGELRIQRFTQTGSTAQILALTGSAVFRTSTGTTWNGALTVSSPTLFLDGSTFNGTGNLITKTGTSTDNSTGSNTFNGATTFDNTGIGSFVLGNANPDAFNAPATFTQTAGVISPSYVANSTATSDIIVNSATPITFGGNGGRITFTGTAAQTISKTGAASPNFSRITMNKAGGSVTLATDINITTTVTFTAGYIFSTLTNYINFAAAATATAASNASFVDGPVRKVGTATFNFPIGNNGIYRTLTISAPGTNSTFTAQYFKAPQPFGGPATYASTLSNVSSCEYWTLDRTAGTANVNVTLNWVSADCSGPYVGDFTKLKVARWNGTSWLNPGSAAPAGTNAVGTVATNPAITAWLPNNPFTLASTSPINPLPITLTSFTATPVNESILLQWTTESEVNNDFYSIERSLDGFEFETLSRIPGAGTKTTVSNYEFFDMNPSARKIYYKLKQTDYNKNSTYSDIVIVNMDEVTRLIVHPNPVSAGKTLSMNYHGNYKVYNTMGVEVMKLTDTNMIEEIALPAGMYIIKTDKGLVERFIVE